MILHLEELIGIEQEEEEELYLWKKFKKKEEELKKNVKWNGKRKIEEILKEIGGIYQLIKYFFYKINWT